MGEQSKSQETVNYKLLMDTTIKVIDIMSLGQLLPPPLSDIRDVIQYFKSHEVIILLKYLLGNHMLNICTYIQNLFLILQY